MNQQNQQFTPQNLCRRGTVRGTLPEVLSEGYCKEGYL